MNRSVTSAADKLLMQLLGMDCGGLKAAALSRTARPSSVDSHCAWAWVRLCSRASDCFLTPEALHNGPNLSLSQRPFIHLQLNPDFVQEVAALEARRQAIGAPELRYLYPAVGWPPTSRWVTGQLRMHTLGNVCVWALLMLAPSDQPADAHAVSFDLCIAVNNNRVGLHALTTISIMPGICLPLQHAQRHCTGHLGDWRPGARGTLLHRSSYRRGPHRRRRC